MRIKLTNGRKTALIKKFEDTKYYCPRCRILFKKNDKSYNLNPTVNSPYYCTPCEKNFNRTTYSEKNKNGRRYHFGKNTEIIKKDIRKHISDVITELWQEGYNVSNIGTITHFSEALIKEMINDFKIENTQQYSVEDFIKILEADIDERDYDLIAESIKKPYKIRKALEMGCSVLIVANLLKVTNETIKKASREQYSPVDDYKKMLEEKLKREKEKTEQDRSQIEKIQRELNQIHKFLQNFNPAIARKRRVPRSKIEIDADRKIITIKGIASKQKKEFDKILSPHTT